MKKLYVFCSAVFITALTFAQSFTDRVLVLNEGYFDFWTNEILTPVTLGSYDPTAGTYATIHTIDDVRFASDLLIDNAQYIIAADNKLLVYDRFTDALIMETEVPGIRKIAVNDDYIVVTRGEYLEAFDNYVLVLNRNDLSPAFAISSAEMQYTTEGTEIIDGKAYVAVNNGFVFGEEVGFIAVIDLSTQTLESMIDLGPNGINPDNLMLDGDVLLTVNNKDFTGSSISVIKTASADVITTDLLNVTSGCGTSAYFDGAVYYQDFLSTSIAKFNSTSSEIIGDLDFAKSFYGLAFDTVNAYMYAAVTDFYSYGQVYIYDLEGELKSTFEAGVSPGNIVFDYRSATAIATPEINTIEIAPNPANEMISITGISGLQQIEIFNVAGQLMQSQNMFSNGNYTVDITQLPAGLYTVRMHTADGTFSKIIVAI